MVRVRGGVEGNFLRVVFIVTNVDENDEKVKNGAWGRGSVADGLDEKSIPPSGVK